MYLKVSSLIVTDRTKVLRGIEAAPGISGPHRAMTLCEDNSHDGCNHCNFCCPQKVALSMAFLPEKAVEDEPEAGGLSQGRARGRSQGRSRAESLKRNLARTFKEVFVNDVLLRDAVVFRQHKVPAVFQGEDARYIVRSHSSGWSGTKFAAHIMRGTGQQLARGEYPPAPQFSGLEEPEHESVERDLTSNCVIFDSISVSKKFDSICGSSTWLTSTHGERLCVLDTMEFGQTGDGNGFKSRKEYKITMTADNLSIFVFHNVNDVDTGGHHVKIPLSGESFPPLNCTKQRARNVYGRLQIDLRRNDCVDITLATQTKGYEPLRRVRFYHDGGIQCGVMATSGEEAICNTVVAYPMDGPVTPEWTVSYKGLRNKKHRIELEVERGGVLVEDTETGKKKTLTSKAEKEQDGESLVGEGILFSVESSAVEVRSLLGESPQIESQRAVMRNLAQWHEPVCAKKVYLESNGLASDEESDDENVLMESKDVTANSLESHQDFCVANCRRILVMWETLKSILLCSGHSCHDQELCHPPSRDMMCCACIRREDSASFLSLAKSDAGVYDSASVDDAEKLIQRVSAFLLEFTKKYLGPRAAISDSAGLEILIKELQGKGGSSGERTSKVAVHKLRSEFRSLWIAGNCALRSCLLSVHKAQCRATSQCQNDDDGASERVHVVVGKDKFEGSCDPSETDLQWKALYLAPSLIVPFKTLCGLLTVGAQDAVTGLAEEVTTDDLSGKYKSTRLVAKEARAGLTRFAQRNSRNSRLHVPPSELFVMNNISAVEAMLFSRWRTTFERSRFASVVGGRSVLLSELSESSVEGGGEARRMEQQGDASVSPSGHVSPGGTPPKTPPSYENSIASDSEAIIESSRSLGMLHSMVSLQLANVHVSRSAELNYEKFKAIVDFVNDSPALSAFNSPLRYIITLSLANSVMAVILAGILLSATVLPPLFANTYIITLGGYIDTDLVVFWCIIGAIVLAMVWVMLSISLFYASVVIQRVKMRGLRHLVARIGMRTSYSWELMSVKTVGSSASVGPITRWTRIPRWAWKMVWWMVWVAKFIRLKYEEDRGEELQMWLAPYGNQDWLLRARSYVYTKLLPTSYPPDSHSSTVGAPPSHHVASEKEEIRALYDIFGNPDNDPIPKSSAGSPGSRSAANRNCVVFNAMESVAVAFGLKNAATVGMILSQAGCPSPSCVWHGKYLSHLPRNMNGHAQGENADSDNHEEGGNHKATPPRPGKSRGPSFRSSSRSSGPVVRICGLCACIDKHNGGCIGFCGQELTQRQIRSLPIALLDRLQLLAHGTRNTGFSASTHTALKEYMKSREVFTRLWSEFTGSAGLDGEGHALIKGHGGTGVRQRNVVGGVGGDFRLHYMQYISNDLFTQYMAVASMNAGTSSVNMAGWNSIALAPGPLCLPRDVTGSGMPARARSNTDDKDTKPDIRVISGLEGLPPSGA